MNNLSKVHFKNFKENTWLKLDKKNCKEDLNVDLFRECSERINVILIDLFVLGLHIWAKTAFKILCMLYTIGGKKISANAKTKSTKNYIVLPFLIPSKQLSQDYSPGHIWSFHRVSHCRLLSFPVPQLAYCSSPSIVLLPTKKKRRDNSKLD